MKTKLQIQNPVLGFLTGSSSFRNISQEKNQNILIKRTKFSQKQRQNIVVEGQSGKSTLGEICQRFGITPSEFYDWSDEFLDSNRKRSLESNRRKRIVSQDEKDRIVLDYLNRSLTIDELCKEEDITQIQLKGFIDEFTGVIGTSIVKDKSKSNLDSKLKKKILEFLDKDAFKYFLNFLDVKSEATIVKRDIEYLSLNSSFLGIKNILSLSRINDVRRINKYFEEINESLPENGLYCGFFETMYGRKKRLNIYSIPIISFVYSAFEFIFKRVIPKIPFTQKLFFSITKGKNRILSKAEVLGRLVSCGFKIVEFKDINGVVYFVVKKNGKPSYDMNPSYGPVYAMPRIGMNGKVIKVFKFRTMHPYSEYLQDFMVETYGYDSKGKPANDFRIPKWGSFLRKYWLDELPQLFNVLKGDMKLVGVRPLSHFRFNEIPKEMQKLREPHKPGCFPPYVALCMPDQFENLQAEIIYLEEKIKHPYITDTKYFFKSIFNMVTNKIRGG